MAGVLMGTSAFCYEVSDITGHWQYEYFNHRGTDYPVDKSSLDLKFTFNSDGTGELKWERRNVNIKCERKSIFEVRDGNTLYQKVTWLNPDNHVSCAEDKDMQQDSESLTRFDISGNVLTFYLDLSGEPLYYYLSRITNDAGSSNQPNGPSEQGPPEFKTPQEETVATKCD